MACGMGFVILHGREWSKLIAEGLTLPVFPKLPGQAAGGEFANVAQTVPQFAATFFWLTGMHMLHVTLGVIYLGVVALRRTFIPILLAFWLAAWLGTPHPVPFITERTFYFCSGRLRDRFVLKPKVYDSSDVEVAGLYWHFVDLVWMLFFLWCI